MLSGSEVRDVPRWLEVACTEVARRRIWAVWAVWVWVGDSCHLTLSTTMRACMHSVVTRVPWAGTPHRYSRTLPTDPLSKKQASKIAERIKADQDAEDARIAAETGQKPKRRIVDRAAAKAGVRHSCRARGMHTAAALCHDQHPPPRPPLPALAVCAPGCCPAPAVVAVLLRHANPCLPLIFHPHAHGHHFVPHAPLVGSWPDQTLCVWLCVCVCVRVRAYVFSLTL